VLKNPTIYFNSPILGSSTCSIPDVVLAFLLYEGSTIRNANDQFVPCLLFLCSRRLSSSPTDKNLKE